MVDSDRAGGDSSLVLVPLACRQSVRFDQDFSFFGGNGSEPIILDLEYGRTSIRVVGDVEACVDQDHSTSKPHTDFAGLCGVSDYEPRGAERCRDFLHVGLVLLFDILAGGPLTGAAMNPARAFGPALASNVWTGHAVYWIGPIAGGLVASLAYVLLQPSGRE